MMSFLKSIWKKKIKIGSFFGATPNELKKFRRGLGESAIQEKSIAIKHYPFDPSQVYPDKVIPADEINEVYLDTYPPTLKLGVELIFISRESVGLLKEFAERNNIPIGKRKANWDWISEPYLDTEFDHEQQERSIALLVSNGISKHETERLRAEIARQMYKYNFDTMLWEWVNLGLYDVLMAMSAKYTSKEFERFYWKAMEVEQRTQ
ncbi:hypothetical protein WJR50_07645 [Catalinimonas sp. 4WD22]|uniref:hypothetical protein n=1 Tax=Catalinimonas locisalis TaxID=3133978 RepID=UPI003100DBA2